MPNRICLITGIGGLIGSECARYFQDKFETIIGMDCNAREEFFGESASVQSTLNSLIGIVIWNTDISIREDVEEVFSGFGSEIDLIIHCAAQPSHDWAASNPHRDFEVNALGTLNLLEAYRRYCPNATFIFTSTNKVYGDRPNIFLNGLLYETDSRYEVLNRWEQIPTDDYDMYDGFNERTEIDQCIHSLFGVSKASADLMVQEYGRYFGLKTGVFRGGCLTGPGHKGAEQHGFLSYLIKCIKHGIPYTIYGHFGKQVRDIIHSYDVATIFDEFYKNPRPGEVYNIGGSRHSNCSILEAIEIIEKKLDKKIILNPYVEIPRKGDHIWYVTDMHKFVTAYPEWKYTYTLDQIIDEIIKSA